MVSRKVNLSSSYIWKTFGICILDRIERSVDLEEYVTIHYQ